MLEQHFEILFTFSQMRISIEIGKKQNKKLDYRFLRMYSLKHPVQ